MKTAIFIEIRKLNKLECLNFSLNFTFDDIKMRRDLLIIPKFRSEKYEYNEILPYLRRIETKDGIEIMLAKQKIVFVSDEPILWKKLEISTQKYNEMTIYNGEFAGLKIPKSSCRKKVFAYIKDSSVEEEYYIREELAYQKLSWWERQKIRFLKEEELIRNTKERNFEILGLAEYNNNPKYKKWKDAFSKIETTDGIGIMMVSKKFLKKELM